MDGTTSTRSRAIVVSVAMALIGAWLAVAPGADAHSGAAAHPGDEHLGPALGIRVNSPAALAGFIPAVQWGGTAEVDDQTGDLMYAGTGCSPASYAAVSDEVRGNVALVDARASETNPADQCRGTFFQKVQSAQRAGAIALVQIPAEGEDPRADADAITADIPALEVERTEGTLALRDEVIAETAVNVTLRDAQEPLTALAGIPCADGRAGPFQCDGVDLLSFVPQEDFDGEGVSDLWGWTDPKTGDEYVIVGKTNGVGFFRVTEPTAPVYLGELPNPAVLQEIWHDVKVYENHAFIVSESEPHGMTVFDLTRLRAATAPQEWDADAFYRLNVAAHNVAINEATGFAYIVGGDVALAAPDQCLSGLHMVDISEPTSPSFAGCYAEEGGPGTAARLVGAPAEEISPAAYVHDTQCVVYHGPDVRYVDREICFNSAEDGLVIADVTDKDNPVTVGVTDYPNVGYAHQGWLTEDHAYLIANDELDEVNANEEAEDGEPDAATRTIVFDVTDLKNPSVHFEHFHETTSIDHNNYVKDGLVFQSNYTSGLRVLDARAVAHPQHPRLAPFAFFDSYPWDSDPTFAGTWSNYPYFESGTIAVSGIDEGLFLLRLAREPGGRAQDRPDPRNPRGRK